MEHLKELRLTIFVILIICFIWVIRALGKLPFVKLENRSSLLCREELTQQVGDCYPRKDLLPRLVLGWHLASWVTGCYL